MVIPTIVGWCYQLLAATRGDLAHRAPWRWILRTPPAKCGPSETTGTTGDGKRGDVHTAPIDPAVPSDVHRLGCDCLDLHGQDCLIAKNLPDLLTKYWGNMGNQWLWSTILKKKHISNKWS